MRRKTFAALVAATALLAGAVGLLLPVRPAFAIGDLIGRLATYKVQPDDTLLDVAQAFGLGFVELRAANQGIDAWIPPPNSVLILPTAHLLPDAPRRGIVINLGELRVYVYGYERGAVESYPIGIGREGMKTPLGTTRIVRKQNKPAWYPPTSIREDRPELPKMVPPGPDNPLGEHALYLGWPSYLMHGTDKPDGVGRRVSHGCIRFYPADIERLYNIIPVGTPVTVIDQPVKFGWWAGQLYMEAHPTPVQVDELELDGEVETPAPFDDIGERIIAAAGDQLWRVNAQLAEQVARERRGIPVRITR